LSAYKKGAERQLPAVYRTATANSMARTTIAITSGQKLSLGALFTGGIVARSNPFQEFGVRLVLNIMTAMSQWEREAICGTKPAIESGATGSLLLGRHAETLQILDTFEEVDIARLVYSHDCSGFIDLVAAHGIDIGAGARILEELSLAHVAADVVSAALNIHLHLLVLKVLLRDHADVL
jgi:hypothetical protein